MMQIQQQTPLGVLEGKRPIRVVLHWVKMVRPLYHSLKQEVDLGQHVKDTFGQGVSLQLCRSSGVDSLMLSANKVSHLSSKSFLGWVRSEKYVKVPPTRQTQYSNLVSPIQAFPFSLFTTLPLSIRC